MVTWPQAGVYRLGPDSAALRVHTGTAGKLARTGHSLVLEVEDWSATVALGSAEPESAELSLTANSRSLRVRSGSGGVQPLDDEAKRTIVTTIDTEVLKGGGISFDSTGVQRGDGADDLHVQGNLTLLGTTRPVEFRLTITPDLSIEADTVVTQTDFGLTPFSAMFGALRVKDEVRVTLGGRLVAA